MLDADAAVLLNVNAMDSLRWPRAYAAQLGSGAEGAAFAHFLCPFGVSAVGCPYASTAREHCGRWRMRSDDKKQRVVTGFVVDAAVVLAVVAAAWAVAHVSSRPCGRC